MIYGDYKYKIPQHIYKHVKRIFEVPWHDPKTATVPHLLSEPPGTSSSTAFPFLSSASKWNVSPHS